MTDNNQKTEQEICVIQSKLARNEIKKARLNKALQELDLLAKELANLISEKNEQQ